MSSSIQVTVLMSVYNGQEYLDESIGSIVSQRFQDFEFVIVDDGSTDDTADILEDWNKKDSRIKVITNHDTLGLTASLNIGIKQAKGKYIARHDADDISLSERLGKQFEFMESHPECVVLGTALLSVDSDGAPLYRELRSIEHEDILSTILKGRGGLAHPTVMIRRDVLLGVGGYDPCYEVAQDIDLWLRLADKGKLANLPEILVHYRHHVKAASVQKRDLQMKNAHKAIAAYYERHGEELPVGSIMKFPAPMTEVETHIYWSGRACYDGFFKSARKHAVKALRMQPSKGSVKAVVRAMLYSFGVKKSTTKNT